MIDSVSYAKEEVKLNKQLVKDDVNDMNARVEDALDRQAEKVEEKLDQAEARAEANRADMEAIRNEAVETLQDKKQASVDRVDAVNAKIENQINAQNRKVEDALDRQADKVEEKLEQAEARVEANRADMEAIHDEAVETLQAKAADQCATVEGNINAAEENLRLAKERYDSKLNAVRLKVQMHREAVEKKIDTKLTELDMAAEERLITDLLDYADDCQMIAYSYAIEAELALLDACDVLTDYNEKFNKLNS